MTIAIAWTRGKSPNEELVFVTDSRLSGDGRTFDACPKIQLLPRPDCAIAFAGSTNDAYPMMQQLSLAIDSHVPLKGSSLDLPIVRSHALKIFDIMSSTIASGIRPASPGDAHPAAEFLLGGYAWRKKKFELWRIAFDKQAVRHVAHAPWFMGYSPTAKYARLAQRNTLVEAVGSIAFAGDQAPVALKRMKEMLKNRAPGKAYDPFDWEPLEIVRDMLRDPDRSPTIGGPPQVLKVHQYPSSEPIGVKWGPDKAKIFLQGRECLGYERTNRVVIDPDSFVISAPFLSDIDNKEEVPGLL